MKCGVEVMSCEFSPKKQNFSKFSLVVVHSVVSDSLQPMDWSMPGFPSFTISKSLLKLRPLSWWCYQTISSSAVPFSSSLQSFTEASGSFPMSLFFVSGSQRIGASVSASVLSMNIQDWFPFVLTGLISLQSKELARVLSNITVQKHQFFSAQTSLGSNSHIHSFDYMELCQQSNASAFGFPSKEKSSFNFMAAVTICSNFWAQKKFCHCLHCFPIYLPWSDGTECHDLSFLNVEF